METTTRDERAPLETRAQLPWWAYEAAVESHADVEHVRARLRARLTGQPGVRIVDVLLIIDVLFTDAFDSGFAQQDLRIAVKISGTRLLIELDAADAPAAIAATLVKAAGETLLDVTCTDWGIRRRGGRKVTWAAIDTSRTPRSSAPRALDSHRGTAPVRSRPHTSLWPSAAAVAHNGNGPLCGTNSTTQSRREYVWRRKTRSGSA